MNAWYFAIWKSACRDFALRCEALLVVPFRQLQNKTIPPIIHKQRAPEQHSSPRILPVAHTERNCMIAIITDFISCIQQRVCLHLVPQQNSNICNTGIFESTQLYLYSFSQFKIVSRWITQTHSLSPWAGKPSLLRNLEQDQAHIWGPFIDAV